jgi:uncharacterized DUF497 family protein
MVGFPEAMTVFGDPLEMTISDPDHSDTERRFLSLGMSANGRLLALAYTERDGRIRIINAREAQARNESTMSPQPNSDEMRAEYDFSDGVRGKHHQAYRTRFLDADVAEVFTDSAAVNQALLQLVKVARTQVSSAPLRRRCRRRAARGPRLNRESDRAARG